jgi:hypothetical protein
MKFTLFILTILLLFSSTNIYSQSSVAGHDVRISIPKVALLNLISNNSEDLRIDLGAPNKAGNRLLSENFDKVFWVNYSSVLNKSNQKRKIVAVMKNQLPKGILLKVQAYNATGGGVGNLGNPTNEVILSNNPSDIITGIGSCYTGQGIENGHFLKYSIEFDKTSEDYALYSGKSYRLDIVYTLTDDN